MSWNRPYQGGAVYIEQGHLSLTENYFTANTAKHGGAIYAHQSKLTMTGPNVFENNSVVHYVQWCNQSVQFNTAHHRQGLWDDLRKSPQLLPFECLITWSQHNNYGSIITQLSNTDQHIDECLNRSAIKDATDTHAIQIPSQRPLSHKRTQTCLKFFDHKRRRKQSGMSSCRYKQWPLQNAMILYTAVANVLITGSIVKTTTRLWDWSSRFGVPVHKVLLRPVRLPCSIPSAVR